MKLGINIVAILIGLMGGVFFLQGIGVLPGSVMTNDSKNASCGNDDAVMPAM